MHEQLRSDMDPIRFMVVSGFLGAGKTTTMISLAEHMNKTYGETAIIANDLGANLVDTNLTCLLYTSDAADD